MKIKSEHYITLKVALATFGPEKVSAHRQFIVNEGKAKDIDKRLRWDLLYYKGMSQWLCDNVYRYADDNHLDTALRQIMRELYPNHNKETV